VEDHPGDHLPAAADRDRHLQRGAGQLGVMVLRQREPDHPARSDIQHRVQVQFALVGDDLGAVTEPLGIDPGGPELAVD